MPFYTFRCEHDGYEVWAPRPMANAGDPEPCKTCGEPMTRIYEPVATNIKGGTPIHHDRAWVRGAGGQGNSIRREK